MKTCTFCNQSFQEEAVDAGVPMPSRHNKTNTRLVRISGVVHQFNLRERDLFDRRILKGAYIAPAQPKAVHEQVVETQAPPPIEPPAEPEMPVAPPLQQTDIQAQAERLVAKWKHQQPEPEPAVEPPVEFKIEQ